jgi:hypothetical protein
MSFNKGVDFYAGSSNVRACASFPQDSTYRIMEYARHKGVDYFVVEERYLSTFPNLEDWVDGTVPDGLKLVYNKPGPSGLHAWIFTWE